MLVTAVRDRMMTALEGTPTVLTALLAPLASEDARWDRRPDPNRFTLREMLAHLVDYEAVWYEYLTTALAENHPTLNDYVPDVLASRRDYGATNPQENLAALRADRPRLTTILRGLDEADWTRTMERPRFGTITLLELATVFLAHDGYHTRQAAEFANSGQ